MSTELHAVESGELKRFSPSQAQTFHACPRQWWFDRVARLKPPQKMYQKAGEDIHAQLEHFVKTGQDVLGPIAKKAVSFVRSGEPSDRGNLLAEFPFEGAYIAGIPFIGYIDLVDLNVPEVIDFKTTKSIERADAHGWIAKGPDLADPETSYGIQMISYAEYIRCKFPEFVKDRITLSHIYIPKSTEPAEKRSICVTVDNVASAWGKIENLAVQAKEAAKIADPDQVRAKVGPACYSYGGCFHQSRCSAFQNQNPKESFKMSLLASAQRMLPPPGVQNPNSHIPITSPPAQQPAQMAAGDCVAGEWYRLNPMVNGQFEGTAKEFAFFVVAQPNGTTERIRMEKGAPVIPLKLTPTPVAAPPPAPQTVAGWPAVVPPDAPKVIVQPPPPSPAPVAAPPPAPPTAPQTLDFTQPKRGPGRPPKASYAMPGTPMPAAPAPMHPMATVPAPAQPTPQAPQTESEALHLFINCIPLSGSPRFLNNGYVQEIMDRAAKIDQVTDYRLVEYARGKGTIASVTESNPVSGNCVIITRDSEAGAIIAEVLAKRAALVIRGI